MISIENFNRDARKSLAGGGLLGYNCNYSDREMEETELEEGEAYDYHDDDDENIDPDVDLSYLDEKVQVVLGHFQKDFEGGVSAENLGAKFGGYGSFLPTHQRSPSVWSQPRTPQNLQSYGTPRSPNNLAMEGDSQNYAVPSAAISSVKHVATSTSSAPPPILRAHITESSSKRDSSLLNFGSIGDSNINSELLNKPNNNTDQKTLKLRLKVGYNNVAQKTAAIFNDLGFPLSSPEDSPLESGGKSPEFRESPYESPTSILQIMTSSPFPDGLLLTPLPDSLLQLTEKKKILRENKSDLWKNYSLVDDSCSVTGEGKDLGGKNSRPVEKNSKLTETKNGTTKVAEDEISVPSNLEVDIETLEGKEFVAESPKKFRKGETVKSTGRVPEVSGEIKMLKVKDRLLPSEFVKGSSNLVTSQDINNEEKLKQRSNVVDGGWEDRKEKVGKDVQSLSGKDGKSKGNNYESCKADFDGLKGRKELNTGAIDPPENKLKLKVTSHDWRGGKLPHGAEETYSGGKKKSKGSKTKVSSPAILSEESLKVASFGAPKERRKSSGDSSSKPHGSKLRKEAANARGTYRNISGDEELEQAENSMDSSEAHFRNAPKDYKFDAIKKETCQYADKPKDRVSGKEIYQSADKSRDRPNVKKVEDSLAPEVYQNVAQNVAPVGNGPLPDMVPAAVAPVLIDSWVACDKCSKWRLLPPGTNENNLPRKWLCSMFNYVPGLKINNCNISEEETTNLVRGLYQIPAPENQNNLHSQSNGVAARATIPDAQSLDPKQKVHKYMSAPSSGKKKHGLKEPADGAGSMGNMPTSDTINKNQQASKSRSLNDVNQSPLDPNLAHKSGMQHVSKSNDSAGGKHRHRQKDKLARDGGVTNQSKTKIKTEPDQDRNRASKKMKAEGFSGTEEEWNSNHSLMMGSSGPTSVSRFPENGFLRDMKDLKFDMKDNPLSSAKKAELVQVSLDVGALDTGRFDNRDVDAKKRKVKEWQESQDFPLDPPTHFGLHAEADNVSLEGTSEGERKRRKKDRGSKSEGKESRRSMVDTVTDKRESSSKVPSSRCRDSLAHEMEEGRGYVDKDQQQTQFRGDMTSQLIDGIDPLKRDLGYGLPLAATSSSSKISGSHKSKANFQEAKGSPVESVSSSPLRISDKGTSARRTLLGKDDPNIDFLANGGLRRCSDGEGDVVGFHTGSAKSEKAHSFVHRASVESSVLGYHDRDAIPTSGDKAKVPIEHRKPHLMNGGTDTVDQHMNGGADTVDQRIDRSEHLDKEHGYDADQLKAHYGCNGSHSRKSGKSSSLKSKEKQKGSRSDTDKGKRKASDSSNKQEGSYSSKKSRKGGEIEPRDLSHYHDEPMGGKYKSQEKYGGKSDKDERGYLGKKDHHDKWSNEGKRENQPKYGGNAGIDVKPIATCSKDGKSNAEQVSMQDRVGERSSHRSFSDRSDHNKLETVSGRGKSHLLHSGEKQETQVRCPRPISSNHKGNDTELLPVDASIGGVGDELKAAKLRRKPDNPAGPGQNSLRHSTPGRVAASDLDGPSPVRKDSSIQAGNVALKEARDLKHSADRLKNSGSGLDGTALYFEAALKFLHGASLLEPTNAESSRHGDCQSVHIYRTTTGLCEFVAQEYERCKEMAFAALAYKCLEVACMRVVFFRHWGVDKDRHELQAALNMAPPGESPSSSASDIDNLNNQGTVDKVALAKGVGSPHVAGHHVIAARNRPSFVRVLNFTQDVIAGFEASRKCQSAFAAASTSLEESQCEGISSVRRAIEYNFYDVQGLLRLVRLAMEAISS